MSSTILHITNAPTPYRLPQYREIDRQLSDIDFRLHVHFLGRRLRERLWEIPESGFEGFDHTSGNPDAGHSAGEAIALIRRLQPAAVVLAWAMDLTALKILVYCRLKGIPAVLYTGETELHATKQKYRFLKRLFRRPFFLLSSSFVAYGSEARRYLRSAGAGESRIFIAINVVDTGFFRSQVDALIASGERSRSRDAYRNEVGEPFAVHSLFVGYLMDNKGVMETLAALHRLDRSDVALHIVGSGPQEEAIRQRIERWNMGSVVFMHGYHQKEELPRFYALADILVFPSIFELFGLVLVEGAAAALPIVATRFAGGAADVVSDGVNGLVVDPTSITEYAAAIDRLVIDSELRRNMGEASRRRADESLTLAVSASGYVQAIRCALNISGR